MGKRKRKEKEEKPQLPWCFYCDREFENEKVLIQHQKLKHFKCPFCPRRLVSVTGLATHVQQVHRESITTVPNAKEGRNTFEYEIFGMEGIPEEFLLQREGKTAEDVETVKRQRTEEQQKATPSPTTISAAPVITAPPVSSTIAAPYIPAYAAHPMHTMPHMMYGFPPPPHYGAPMMPPYPYMAPPPYGMPPMPFGAPPMMTPPPPTVSLSTPTQEIPQPPLPTVSLSTPVPPPPPLPIASESSTSSSSGTPIAVTSTDDKSSISLPPLPLLPLPTTSASAASSSTNNSTSESVPSEITLPVTTTTKLEATKSIEYLVYDDDDTSVEEKRATNSKYRYDKPQQQSSTPSKYGVLKTEELEKTSEQS